MATVDDIRPFIMASVKEGALDIDRCQQLIKSYQEQLLKQSKRVPSPVQSTRVDEFSDRDGG